jgi:excinuclease UvrABC helicase subunit UvrB
VNRDDILRSLVKIQYNRNDVAFERGTFRVSVRPSAATNVCG